MKRLVAAFSLLLLAGCDQASSRAPLLSAGGSGPQPGLWALLEPECPQPTTGAIGTWPECATPVWLQDGVATVVVRQPVRAEFIVAEGDPRILRVSEDGDEGRLYRYYAFRTQDAPPHRRALVWPLLCSERDRTPSEVEGGCELTSEAEVRRLARAVAAETPGGRAVHIGPG